MPTHVEIKKEKELLARLGMAPVNVWPSRCEWINRDGENAGTLACDVYSRILYMGRGLRPVLATPQRDDTSKDAVDLVDAVENLVGAEGVWEGTTTDMLEALPDTTPKLPVDAIRMSKALTGLTSPLAVRNITVERIRHNKRRAVRLVRR